MTAPPSLRIETRTGDAIRPLLPALARLRTAVFREWPYLYDGVESAERVYLGAFANSPRAGMVVAFDGEEPVGAATCLPLTDETENVIAPFRARGWDPARFFYFGESVLLRPYRGRGAGVEFFRQREAHARRVSDCDYACFCAVQRPADHPARPADAVPLDAFWRRRGYTPYPDLTCRMGWKEVGGPKGGQNEVENTLAFWMRPLRDRPLPKASMRASLA